MMMDQHQQHRRTTPSPYLYDVDPGLHASQKPSEVPRVKRNLVQNLVDKFNEEAKQRELCRHHSVDDSLITNHHHHHSNHQHHSRRSPANGVGVGSGVIEANADNAPNHNHPFSYTTTTRTTTTSNKDRKSTVGNGVLAGQRSRSDYNIGPNRKSPTEQRRVLQRPSEVIYAHVMVNGGGGGAGADKSRRTKTTVHTKVPNRKAEDSSRAFTKSTGSLNMSAHEEQDDLMDRQQLKNGNYYRYAEVDENIHRGSSRKSGGSGGVAVDGRRRTLDPIADNRLDVSLAKNKSSDGVLTAPATENDLGKAYETRNVDRWSENEVKPHSRKYTEHEYVHEVSVSRDNDNKMASTSPIPIPIMPIPKEDYFAPRERRVNRREEHKSQTENERKWYSLHRNGHVKSEPKRMDRWSDDAADDWRRPGTIDKHGQHDLKRYYFGQSPNALAPDKPPRQKWRHDVLDGDGRRHRRNSEESAASSGVGLLSSKLVKKANERFGGGIGTDFDDGGGHISRSPFPSRRRRVSEGDSDVFPLPPSSSSLSRRFDDRDRGRLIEYDATGRMTGDGFTEESRKVTRREETETQTRHRRTQTTTRHRSPHDRIEGHDDVVAVGTERQVHRQNGDGRPEEQPIVPRRHHQQQQQQKQQHVQRQTEMHERSSSSSSASRRRHQRLHHNHHHQVRRADGGSDATTEDKMETSESEQPLYGGSQESRMSLGSRLSLSADDEPLPPLKRPVDDVNTPQSVVRQMDKRQINYENAQHHRREVTTSTQGNKSNAGGRRFWFERSTDEDARNNNMNDKNSNEWTSATLSRLETNKNHRNGGLGVGGGGRWASNTIDRNDVRQQQQQQQQQQRNRHHNGHEIRIQVNDEDVPATSGRSGSSYHSESESQVSPGVKTKRVNFKSKSTANLSPVHREALLRSASPARAPSVSGSLRSNDSDGSHVIQHATAVADIPPAREYRLRSANTSPSPPVSSLGGSNSKKKAESRTVRRSFSLLAPWKPRKYRDQSPSPSPSLSSSTSKRSAKNGSAPNLMHDGIGAGERARGKTTTATATATTTSSSGNASPQVHFKKRSSDDDDNGAPADVRSRDSSSEKLDSLSPLPSESASKSKSKRSVRSGKKKSGLLRRHSMPKDSRFANFFRRKKDKEAKK